jgi:hypothetical protein
MTKDRKGIMLLLIHGFNVKHSFSQSIYRTFSIIETSREEADWGRNWTTAFYLDVKTSSFSHRVIFGPQTSI